MSNGLFANLDIASAESDPWKIAPDWYLAVVSDVKVGPNRNQDKIGMTIFYTLESGKNSGQNVSEWITMPQPSDPKNPTPEEARQLSFLKARLLSLGVPEAKMNGVTREDLLATEVAIKVTEGKNDFPNVAQVVLRKDFKGTVGETPAAANPYKK